MLLTIHHCLSLEELWAAKVAIETFGIQDGRSGWSVNRGRNCVTRKSIISPSDVHITEPILLISFTKVVRKTCIGGYTFATPVGH